MDKAEEINIEIKNLEAVLLKIDLTRMSKQNARDLKSYIEIFNHTFSVNFPLSVNHYKRNQSNEIDVTDGLKDLERYGESKLKQKDDYYFWDGKKRIKCGIQGIIKYLEADKVLISTKK